MTQTKKAKIETSKKKKVTLQKKGSSANKEKVQTFFELAQNTNNLALASRYIYLARQLGQKTQTRMTKEQRMQYCHKCYTYLKVGTNATVRKNKYLAVTCMTCGHVNRFL
jgi:ribonuclease P protein subunit RPR2